MMTGEPDQAGASMRPERVDQIREHLLATVRDEPRRRQATRRRRAIWSTGGVVLLAAASVAGAVALKSSTVSENDVVHCFSAATLNPDGSYPGSAATVATETGPGRVDDALSLCREMWSQGVLDDTFDPRGVDNPPGSVPSRLTVCVMTDGSAAVIPGDSGVCIALGLAPLKE